MKKLLLVWIILWTIFSLIHVSYAVTSFEKNVVTKNFILAKTELRKNVTGWERFITLIDDVFIKNITQTEQLELIITRVQERKAKLWAGTKNKTIQRILEYIEYRASYNLAEKNEWNTAPDVTIIDPKDVNLEQYTPDQAKWWSFETKPFASGTNTSHDPDGVGWLSPESWVAAAWDGTVYNPSEMSKSELQDAICPKWDQIRGLREVFYETNPFADNKNPTKAEIDEWHRISINHVRALVGYTSEDRQIKKDQCLFQRAHWGDERKFTTMWDSEYPGTNGSAAWPCQGSWNSHCGATFIPSVADQQIYLPDSVASCGTTAWSEWVFSWSKSNIPWSIKWSRSFCSTLGTEWFWGGHTGPWFHREKFWFSFWDTDINNNNNNAILRAKWGGNLMPSLYPKP
jgi:hypothetical protein